MKGICEGSTKNNIVIVCKRARLPKLEYTPEMSLYLEESAT